LLRAKDSISVLSTDAYSCMAAPSTHRRLVPLNLRTLWHYINQLTFNILRLTTANDLPASKVLVHGRTRECVGMVSVNFVPGIFKCGDTPHTSLTVTTVRELKFSNFDILNTFPRPHHLMYKSYV